MAKPMMLIEKMNSADIRLRKAGGAIICATVLLIALNGAVASAKANSSR